MLQRKASIFLWIIGAQAYHFFEKCEFKSLLRGAPAEKISPAVSVDLHKKYKFVLVDTAEELALGLQ